MSQTKKCVFRTMISSTLLPMVGDVWTASFVRLLAWVENKCLNYDIKQVLQLNCSSRKSLTIDRGQLSFQRCPNPQEWLCALWESSKIKLKSTRTVQTGFLGIPTWTHSSVELCNLFQCITRQTVHTDKIKTGTGPWCAEQNNISCELWGYYTTA